MEILLLDGIVEGGKAFRATIGATTTIRPDLKPEEVLNNSGCFSREDLDRMLSRASGRPEVV